MQWADTRRCYYHKVGIVLPKKFEQVCVATECSQVSSCRLQIRPVWHVDPLVQIKLKVLLLHLSDLNFNLALGATACMAYLPCDLKMALLDELQEAAHGTQSMLLCGKSQRCLSIIIKH